MKRTWKLDESRTFYLCLSEEHFKLGVSNHIKEGDGINGRKRWKPNTVLPVDILDSFRQLESEESDSSSSDEDDYGTESLLDNIGNGFDPTESSQSVKDVFSDDEIAGDGDELYETESEDASDIQSLSQSQSQSETASKGTIYCLY